MEKLFKLLSDTQASLFVLFQKTWVYHWNVTGSEFYQFHTVFGEQYEAMFEEIDKCICLCSNCHRILHSEGE